MGKRLSPAKDVDLVPIMNLVTILIPFLLMAATFVSLAVVDCSLPSIIERVPDGESVELTLSVLITDEGYTITGADSVLGEEALAIPCAAPGCREVDSWDAAELSRILSLVKDDLPDQESVILVPEPRIPYEVLVRTMDATRQDVGTDRDLFPYVVIAGGVE